MNKWGMCISAAMSEQESALKIVHTSSAESTHTKGALQEGQSRSGQCSASAAGGQEPGGPCSPHGMWVPGNPLEAFGPFSHCFKYL